MMIVLANTKGGVGKSTLAVHLACWAHHRGFRTAVLDTDKQRSSSQWIAECEPEITIRTADTPEDCLSEAKILSKSHDLIVADGPAGLDDVSRTLLILADLAILPLTPSILDLRSVQQATSILKFAQGINKGKPEGRIVLNKMRTRDNISRELKQAAPGLGVAVAKQTIRDLQAYRDAAQQGSVTFRMGRKALAAAADMDQLFREIVGKKLKRTVQVKPNRRVANG